MPFPTINQVPTTIGVIRVRLVDEDGVPANMKAYYDVDVLDQDGNKIESRGTSGNLIPHLTAGQISALVDFMDTLRTKAETEWL
jgi:hypothetical protein